MPLLLLLVETMLHGHSLARAALVSTGEGELGSCARTGCPATGEAGLGGVEFGMCFGAALCSLSCVSVARTSARAQGRIERASVRVDLAEIKHSVQ